MVTHGSSSFPGVGDSIAKDEATFVLLDEVLHTLFGDLIVNRFLFSALIKNLTEVESVGCDSPFVVGRLVNYDLFVAFSCNED